MNEEVSTSNQEDLEVDPQIDESDQVKASSNEEVVDEPSNAEEALSKLDDKNHDLVLKLLKSLLDRKNLQCSHLLQKYYP